MEDYYKEKNIKVQKKKHIKNILKKLLYILLIPILIWNLIITVKAILNPNKIPSVFGIKTFCIISGSMEPNIHINDMIIVKEVTENEINKEDIITFVTKGETITHRVINIENKNGELIYTTQGDSNNIEDINKITFKDIEGKYIGKIPKIGKIVLTLKNKEVLGFTLAILICIYIINQKNANKKNKRASERIEYEKEKK